MIAVTTGISVAAAAPTQSASVDTSRSMPSRAYVALWRLSGRCRLYLENRTWASSLGPARPRAIGCDGAGGCVIASQARQENFSRTCWITFHWRGMIGHILTDLAQRSAPTAGEAAGAG